MTLRLRHPLLLLALLVAFAGRSATAKTVRVQWDEVAGAAHYEIEIRRGETVVETAEVPAADRRWRGKLAPAYYEYRIRAFDRVERSGEWSKPAPLVVTPHKPEPIEPKDDAKVVLDGGPQEPTLLWKDAEPAQRYTVEWELAGKAGSGATESARFDLPAPMTGKAKWRVRGESVGPKGVTAKAGPWSRWASFRVVVDPEYLRSRRKLEAPKTETAKAPLAVLMGGDTELRWTEVLGAEEYEIHWERTDGVQESGDRVVRETRARVPVEPGGRYRYRVQAAAGGGDKRVRGPASEAAFVTEDTVRWTKDTQVELLAGVEGYRLQAVVGDPAIRAKAGGTALRGDLRITSWGWGAWGVALEADAVATSVSGATVVGSSAQPKALRVGARRRFPIAGYRGAWQLETSAGLSAHQHLFLAPDGAAPVLVTRTDLVVGTAFGPWVSAVLRYRLSESTALGFRFDWSPSLLTLSGIDGAGAAFDQGALRVVASHRLGDELQLLGQMTVRQDHMKGARDGRAHDSRLQSLGLSVGLGLSF